MFSLVFNFVIFLRFFRQLTVCRQKNWETYSRCQDQKLLELLRSRFDENHHVFAFPSFHVYESNTSSKSSPTFHSLPRNHVNRRVPCSSSITQLFTAPVSYSSRWRCRLLRERLHSWFQPVLGEWRCLAHSLHICCIFITRSLSLNEWMTFHSLKWFYY